jgi:hypothetical protein
MYIKIFHCFILIVDIAIHLLFFMLKYFSSKIYKFFNFQNLNKSLIFLHNYFLIIYYSNYANKNFLDGMFRNQSTNLLNKLSKVYTIEP